MKRRLMTYTAAFFAGLAVWGATRALIMALPTLSWDYPALAMITGMTFPGGASPAMHFLNHMVATWFPFLVAYIVARVLSHKRARAFGAIGTYLGGAALYLWLVEPRQSDQPTVSSRP